MSGDNEIPSSEANRTKPHLRVRISSVMRRFSLGAVVLAVLAMIGLYADVLSIVPRLSWPVTTPSPIAPTATKPYFDFYVRTVDVTDGKSIDGVQVMVEMPQFPPFEELSDSRGVTRFRFPSEFDRLTVKLVAAAKSYKPFIQNISLDGERLPLQVAMIPLDAPPSSQPMPQTAIYGLPPTKVVQPSELLVSPNHDNPVVAAMLEVDDIVYVMGRDTTG